VSTALVAAASPPDAIIGYALRHRVDLVVMATHGRTGIPRLLMGSVAERVVRHASCPVLVARSHAGD
jgi:nucleotide-binding universal stress UspA family protein